jgi:hypothetical protein
MRQLDVGDRNGRVGKDLNPGDMPFDETAPA